MSKLSEIHKTVTVRDIGSRSRWKVVSIVEQVTQRDSVLPTENYVEDVGRLTTSRQCAGQCRDQNKARNYQGATVQFTISD